MDRKRQLEAVLDRWEEGEERGEPRPIDELCADCPELMEEVKQKIAAIREVNAWLGTRNTGADATDDETLTADADSPTIVIESEYGDLKFHAQGGLGSVYVAQDKRIHRNVVLKFIRHRFAGDPDCRDRFALEAEVTGRLEHPGVVPLYSLGQTEEGRMFYAMRFIQGDTLKMAIDQHHRTGSSPARGGEQSLEFRGLLNRFLAVCETIAYAHNRCIVHRDIKPENVMLGRYGETLVVDWGLAMPFSRDPQLPRNDEKTLTPESGKESGKRFGRGVGTPAYMSPEQTIGSDPAPASDIYSLGVTLYKVLTGKTPFEGQDLHTVRQNVILGKFPRPSVVQPNTPPALEAVCLKAMAFKPVNRYPTALDLARDMENYLADEPVSAYPERKGQRAARWVRRHRAAAKAGVGAVFAVILLAVLAAGWFARVAEGERAARVAVEQARRQGLRTAAKFAARTVGAEIDLRWRILEAQAGDADLRAAVGKINQDPDDETLWAPVQVWLDKRYISENQTARAVSWFVNAEDGTQIARTPETDVAGKRYRSIGRNFAYRDYFHGLGRELPPEEAVGIRPLSDKAVYKSNVFQSINTGTLMVVFSTPIWSDSPGTADRRRIGVLAMSVELGEFGVLQTNLAGGQVAMLIDAEDDMLEEEPKGGRVLHHPELGRRTRNDLPPRLDDAILARVRLLAESSRESAAAEPADDENLVDDFRDPVSEDTSGGCLAALEPIEVKGRPPQVANTGWVVVIEQRESP